MIAQKDFQITCLNDKLQQFLNFNPMMNQMPFLNFNPFIEQSNISNNKKILSNPIPLNLNIIFILDKGKKITIQCQNNEEIKTIIQKFSTKAGIEEENYFFL